jgi:hypothetical protein
MNAPPIRATAPAQATVTPASVLDLLHGPLPPALARDDFTNLVVLLRHAKDGSFAFALYNSVAIREQVVQALRPLLSDLPIHQWTYAADSPHPSTYLERLTPDE